MTLKEELEILRGEPIEVFTSDPMDIPCIETSDQEKLCKHPVVSVAMITYNHEPYIRQAIEGVMMQQTDFEFELVIGEDASSDRTREICFEYQKKYPDKIRILWWHENLYRNPHPAGGNGRRTRAHCRGEFIALCEGDDYWIDPLKLQKQVDAMRQYPSVGYCVTGARVLCEVPRNHPRLKVFHVRKWNEDGSFDFEMRGYSPGLIPSSEFWKNRNVFPRTATVMFRQEYFRLLLERFEIFHWRLNVGDALLWMGFPNVSDEYYIEDQTAVYRLNFGGVTFSPTANNVRGHLEGAIIEFYFAKVMGRPIRELQLVFDCIFTKRVLMLEGKDDWSRRSFRELLKTCVFVPNALRVNRGFWAVFMLLRRFGFRISLERFKRFYSTIRHPQSAFTRFFRGQNGEMQGKEDKHG